MWKFNVKGVGGVYLFPANLGKRVTLQMLLLMSGPVLNIRKHVLFLTP